MWIVFDRYDIVLVALALTMSAFICIMIKSL